MIAKLTLREIRKSLGRFLAILAIVTLGAGFFIGLRLTKSAMIKTLDQFVDEHAMFDYHLVSTLGFTQADVEALSQEPGIAAAEGSAAQDALFHVGEQENLVFHCSGLPSRINTPQLIVGRLPETAAECLGDEKYFTEDQIGETIVLSADNSSDTLDGFTRDTYTLVGLVKSPLYINFERGSTKLGSGVVSGFLYFQPETLTSEIWTDVYLTLSDKTGGVYTDAYRASVDAMREPVTRACEARAQLRYETLLGDQQAKLDDAGRELEAGWQAYWDGQQEYETGKKELEDGRAEAAQSLQAASDQLQSGQRELDAQRSTLADSRAQLTEGQAQLESGKQALAAAQETLTAQSAQSAQELDDQQASLQSQLEQVCGAIESLQAQLPPEEDSPAYAALMQQIQTLQEQKAQLEAGLQSLEQTRAAVEEQLRAAQAELDAQRSQLEATEQELSSGWAQLYAGESAFAQAEQSLQTGWAQYREAEQASEEKLASAQAELDSAAQQLADSRAELEDGQAQLEEGRRALQDLQAPTCYVLDRTTNVGYACFESDSDIVAGISTVFPAFFFLVAALVCMTTMTRMVEEQRTQLGVLKALGYGKAAIMGKFLLYSGVASLAGCVLGALLGSRFMPLLIWKIYNIMYDFTGIVWAFDWPMAVVFSAAYLFGMLAVTWFACGRALSEVPAALIRPRAPKSGKRVLLERITPLWKRLRFLHKVSVRNVLRDKRRIAMIVLGVGGCTALLLTGYGLRDSIAGVADDQYSEVTLYDGAVTFSEDMGQAAQTAFAQRHDDVLEECLFAAEESLDVSSASAEKNVTVVALPGAPDGFVDLHSGDAPLEYPGTGEAVIDAKLAGILSVSVGDTITVRDGNLRAMTLTVAGVCDNYIDHYVWITQETWEGAYGTPPALQTAFFNFQPETDAHTAAAALSDDDTVVNVVLNDDIRQRIGNMMKSMNYVVLLVILCAGALAFIVLYNLTNINITERIREIATIKVLGFYENETASYVLRENLLLTFLGAACGLPMGVLLHRFVMSKIKVDMVAFMPQIDALSYLFSVALTILFAIVVGWFMRLKLRRVDMAGALKSVE